MKNKYEIFLEGLGYALRNARIEKGYTQAQLGQKSGRNQSAIGKIERGPVPGVPLNVLFEVAEAIPVSLTELFIIAEKYQATKKYEKKLTTLVKTIENLPKPRKESIEIIIREALALVPGVSSKRT